VRFGDCVFDSEARQLTVAGEPVALSPRAFELLALLLAHRPRALPQAELRDRLWPDTVVSYTSVARLVSEVRHATGDRRRQPRFIRTLHGFGYAFCGEAVDTELSRGAAAGGAFTGALIWGTREIGLREGENLIGRAGDCGVHIDSQRVSRHHARILVRNGQAAIEDLGSKNGTFVGSRRVDQPTPLADGDQLKVGSAVLFYRRGHAPRSTETGRSGS
jgi:DNA-binding winged helix-turn-helix (wHTH) protein